MKSCSKKTCTQRNPQPLTEFHARGDHPTRLRSQCVTCERQYTAANSERGRLRARKWYSENLQRIKDQNRLKLYKLSPEKHKEMFDQQQGRCVLCDRHHNELRSGLCVDHCHNSGAVRGLLCHMCNRALGLFRERPNVLLKAIEYLKKTSS